MIFFCLFSAFAKFSMLCGILCRRKSFSLKHEVSARNDLCHYTWNITKVKYTFPCLLEEAAVLTLSSDFRRISCLGEYALVCDLCFYFILVTGYMCEGFLFFHTHSVSVELIQMSSYNCFILIMYLSLDLRTEDKQTNKNFEKYCNSSYISKSVTYCKKEKVKHQELKLQRTEVQILAGI